MQRWKNRWIRRNAGARAALRTRPASADGSRRCADCARNAACPKGSRAGNHVDCFVPHGNGTPAGNPNASENWGSVGTIFSLAAFLLLFLLFQACTAG